MKDVSRKITVLILLIVTLVFWCANAGMVFGQKQAAQPAALKERAVLPKPDKTPLTDKVRHDVIMVKFREGTRVRARSGQLLADLGNLSTVEADLLRRNNLDHSKVVQELNQVNNLSQNNSNLHFERLFTRSEDDLDLEKQAGESNVREELADLNLYYRLLIENARPEETEQLIEQLNALDVVEIAYPQPISEPAQAPPPTPNFTANQGYVGAAPNGIDALYARNFPGGRGEGVRVIDIEGGWNLNHEDLPATFYSSGSFNDGAQWRQHGTAVLGVIAGVENGFGITGIAPRAAIGVSAEARQMCIAFICWTIEDSPDAINRAAAQLRAGDLLLIEMHRPGPRSGQTCNCNCSQFEFIPIEFWQADFDAIRNATARGIVVVEAGGNGSMDLDSQIYNGAFNRSTRDSGAIIVGAGTSNGRAPQCWTNSGSRVDVQGWGDSVVTLGYGDLFMIQGNDRRWYTSTFSGTSSASPIVTGAAAAVQGFRIARGLPVLNPTQMRTVLRSTGTAQATSARQIGPLPNLRAAIDAHGGGCTNIVPTQNYQFGQAFLPPNGFRDYCFTAVQGQAFEFTTCSPGSANFDTIIDVRDATGSTILASNDDACGLQSRVVWQAPSSGSYRARMRGFSSANGNFTMAYRFTPPACTATISPAPSFQSASGSIGSGGFRDYCFNAVAGQQFDFQTCAPGSASFNTVIEVLNAGGNVIQVTSGACGAQSRVNAWPAPSDGQYRARVHGSGLASGSYSLAYRLTNGAIAGRVTTASGGVAINNAGVHAYIPALALSGFAWTDAAGNYRISGLTPGNYTVYVEVDRYVTQTRTGVAVNADSTTTVNFQMMGALGSISGVVTNAFSAPINGASVQARQGGVLIRSTTSSVAGMYMLLGLPQGSYDVTVSAAGFSPQTRSITVNFGLATRADFILPVPGTIAGRVTRASDGAPIFGATVQARQGSFVTGSATTDASGNYTISNLAAGFHDVVVSAAGFLSQTAISRLVSSGSTTTANFSLVIAPGAISGRVTRSSDGAPISGARVQAFRGGLLRGSITTNGTGNYSMENLAPGTYTIAAMADGFDAQTTSRLVNAGATITVNFSLVALPGAIAGQVTKTSDGTPISGATLQAIQGGVVRGSATTDAGGNYRLGNLAPGVYTLTVRASAYNPEDRPDISVVAGATASANIGLTPLPVSFAPAAALAVGANPSSIVVNDLDGDQRPDLAVANFDSGTASVLLNAGGGTFSPAVHYTVGAGPLSINEDDFDADGKMDLIVANRDANTVTILFGNGDGTFGSSASYSVGTLPVAVTSADFNNDGYTDIVAANRDANSVSLLLNNGDGTLGSATDFGASAAPSALAIVDFNSDGNYDLAIANRDANSISILLGDGAGSFSFGAPLTAGSAPVFLIADDFNGDSKLDLAVANSGSNDVSIFLSNGDGTFAATGNFPVGTSPYSLATGDFNADGKEDLAVVNRDSNSVSILLGNGDGTFAPAITLPVGFQQPISIVSADLDGDGRPDLAVVNAGSNTVSILINNTIR